MTAHILTLNAGSSSTKFGIYNVEGETPLPVASGQVEGIGTHPHFVARSVEGTTLAESYWEVSANQSGHVAAFDQIWQWVQTYIDADKIKAVGHRVAHGGSKLPASALIDEQLMQELHRLIPLVPLHQPHNIAAIQAVASALPGLPQVACFDTGFHRGREAVTERLGLPFQWHEKGIRRYGFHGLSYEYIARTLKTVAPDVAQGRVVVAHLGSGCSLCALKDGTSIETSMGFSSLDGLPMGTRCGSIDPGVLMYLQQQEGLSLQELEKLLYKNSGLLGLSGVSNDMRALRESDDPRAAEAIEYFVYQTVKHIGSLISALEGLDALVFTAGIGEHDAQLRLDICKRLQWLGLSVDPVANHSHKLCISQTNSKIKTLVIPTNEELMIANHTVETINQ